MPTLILTGLVASRPGSHRRPGTPASGESRLEHVLGNAMVPGSWHDQPFSLRLSNKGKSHQVLIFQPSHVNFFIASLASRGLIRRKTCHGSLRLIAAMEEIMILILILERRGPSRKTEKKSSKSRNSVVPWVLNDAYQAITIKKSNNP
jgi:hypothetical protein